MAEVGSVRAWFMVPSAACPCAPEAGPIARRRLFLRLNQIFSCSMSECVVHGRRDKLLASDVVLLGIIVTYCSPVTDLPKSLRVVTCLLNNGDPFKLCRELCPDHPVFEARSPDQLHDFVQSRLAMCSSHRSGLVAAYTDRIRGLVEGMDFTDWASILPLAPITLHADPRDLLTRDDPLFSRYRIGARNGTRNVPSEGMEGLTIAQAEYSSLLQENISGRCRLTTDRLSSWFARHEIADFNAAELDSSLGLSAVTSRALPRSMLRVLDSLETSEARQIACEIQSL